MIDENEVLDNLDFQQEKREEMELEANIVNELEICSFCGAPLIGNQLVYKNRDNTYSHTRCVLDGIENDSIEYSDVLEARRDRASTEDIF